MDVSRQANTTILEQAKFTGKLEEDDGATISFVVEKQQNTILNLSLDS